MKSAAKWFARRDGGNKCSLFVSIHQAFLFLTPLFVIGACALAVQNFPAEAVRNAVETAFGGRLGALLDVLYRATYGFVAVYLVFTLSYFESLPRSPYMDVRIFAAVSSTACYFAFLGPEVLRGGRSLLSYTNMANIFPAMLIALVFTRLFYWLYNRLPRRADIRSTAFARGMHGILPLLFCLCLVSAAVEAIGAISSEQNFNDLVVTLLAKPFESVGAGYLGGAMVLFFESALWMFSIHGGNVLDSLLTSKTGAFAFSRGQIVCKPFLDTYALLGGCGMSVCLLLAVLLFSRDGRKRHLCGIAGGTILFNINELLFFGLPVVLNPIYAIPFVLAPLAAYTIAYLATAAGLVPQIVNASVEWTTPVFISGYQATGSVAGSVLQLVVLVVGVAIYAPFVRLEDRLTKESESRYLERLTEICRACETQRRDYALGDENVALSAFEDDVAAKLQRDIAGGSILLQYQPQVKGEKIVAAEALLRFRFNGSPFLYPPLVVGIACTERLFDPLSRAIVRRALDDLRTMQQSVPAFKIAVNMRLDLLMEEDFRAWLVREVAASGVTPGTFGVELTEDANLSDTDSLRAVFDELKQAGIDVLMDDFSMGHTSITILQKNYFDYVKIDGSLVRALDNERSRSIISSIARLGQELRFQLIAEYVETEEQRDMLTALGCHIFQGYLYYKDLPAEELSELLRKQVGQA